MPFRSPLSRLLPALVLLVCANLTPGRLAAQDDLFDEVSFSGSVTGEGRLYLQDPQFPGQFDGFQASLVLQPELEYESDDGRHQLSLEPFLRLDSRDRERSHWDLREAYWRFTEGDWDVLAGLSSVFWGVTESRHLVNVVNQVDQLEDIDREDFLGQPMIQVGWQQDWGRVEAFVLPGFRALRFPGDEGRLRTPLPVDDGFNRFDFGFESFGPDLALRYSHYFGDWDVGLSYFYGNGREARLLLAPGGLSLRPDYEKIHQGGLDLQLTSGDWLWKFEGILRQGQGPFFAAAVGGFEYTYYQAFETDADIGLLAEYLYDGRDNTRAPFTVFDNDIFAGARISLNDVDDSAALIGAVVDHERGSIALSLEAERRLGDSWKAQLESRLFFNVDSKDPLTFVKQDDYVLFRLSYFF